MFKRFYNAVFVSSFLFVFLMCPVYVVAEDALWVIYNTVYGGNYVGDNAELDATYGVAYDETFLETNGYVEASARYAGYTQLVGYYTDLCVGSERYELFNVTVTTPSGYLYECSTSGGECIEDSDCPGGETCEPMYGATFLVDGDVETIGFYDDPSGSPIWYSQPILNGPNYKDHWKAYRAPDPLS